MAGRSKKNGVIFAVIYVTLLISVFIPYLIAMFTMTGTGIGSVEYDRDPLVLRKVKIINRGDSYREYETDEYSTLCEIVITYENTGWYTSEYGDRPEIYGCYISDSIEEYLGNAWLNSSSELAYEASGEHPIPAGKTGTRQYFVELYDGMTEVVVRETSDKLDGKGTEVVLSIPEGEWVSVETSVITEE